MRNEPCKQCGFMDFYVKGKFSYCRPCHNQAQRRYAAKNSDRQLLQPPAYSLEYLMTKKKSAHAAKTHCKKGHPFSGDNVKITSQDNGRLMRRYCRACKRNAKRVKYGLEPEPSPMTLGKMLDEQG